MSQPQTSEVEVPPFEISLEDKIEHRLSGYTVDILLERGDTPGAGAELERLLLAGMDSSQSVEATEFLELARQKLRRQAEDPKAKKTA